MKIRTDFVTNSSSSSFIIGKNDSDITKTDVFNIIKKFYQDFLNKRDELIKYINENPELEISYLKKEKYCMFSGKNKKWDSESIAITKMLEEKFGISIWDNFDLNYDWLNCETYEEYVKYWLDLFSKDEKARAPFTIGCFLDDNITWLHWGKGKLTVHNTDETSELIGWYYAFISEDCDGNCEHCSIYKEDKDECQRQHDILKTVENKNLCLSLLGKHCIYSESGYIPDYVVNKLSTVSEYCCNHMG